MGSYVACRSFRLYDAVRMPRRVRMFVKRERDVLKERNYG